MSIFLLIAVNVLAAVASTCVADVAMARREPWRRALAAVAGFPVLALAVVLVCGRLGILAAGPVTALTFFLAGLAWLARRRRFRRDPGAVACGAGDRHLLLLAGGLIFAAFALLAGSGPYWGGGHWFHGDDLSYHGPAVAEWIAAGRLVLAPGNYHAYYPQGGETLSLWFALPLGSDALVRLAGAVWAAVAAVSAAALVLSVRPAGPWALVPGVLILVSPVVVRTASCYAAVDLAAPAATLAALAFAAPSRGPMAGRGVRVDALYAGLLAGCAVGCKVSFAPVAAVVVIWFATARTAGARRQDRLLAALVCSLGVIATGGFWFIRNAILTGNPVFPGELGPLGGPFDAATQERTRLLHWMLESPGDGSPWPLLMRRHLAWPAALLAASLVGYVLAIVGLLRRRVEADTAGKAVRMLLILVGLLLVVLYPTMPFSGTDNAPDAPLRVENRFLVAPFAIGLVLLGVSATDGRVARILTILLAGLGGVLGAVRVHPLFPIPVLAGAIVVLLLRRSGARRPFRGWVRDHGGPAVALGVVVLLGLTAGVRQRRVLEVVSRVGGEKRPVGRAWRAVEDLPDGAVLAVFAPRARESYALYGSRFQHRLIPVGPDGRRRPLLHEVWRRDRARVLWWSPPAAEVDPHALAANLVRAGVEYVLVSQWDGDEWPPQQSALGVSGRAERVFDDGYSTLWRLRQPGD